MTNRFFTIGHSNRSLDAFFELLKSFEVKLIVDVRTVPRSRANPQYNSIEFSRALAEVKIQYEHMAALGGRRGRSQVVPADVNGLWRNQSFHNYADYAMSTEFRSNLARLREVGRVRTCAIMCAEAVWWRCHRRIIADYLIAAGETVLHILGPKHAETAQLTDGARVGSDGQVFYRSHLAAKASKVSASKS